VAAYLVTLNATQAAKDAGYSPRTANEQGARLLANVSVAAAIEVAMKEREKRTEISQDRVLQELGRIAFLDIGKAFNADGTLKPLDEIDEDTRRALAGLEVTELRDADGFAFGHAKKLKFADKLGALGKIAQHLGMLDPKITLKGDTENPLQLLIKAVQGNSLKPVRQSAWGGDEREDEVIEIEGKRA